jgi:hypothetical protein
VPRRTIDIRRQPDAVPGRDDEIPIDNHCTPGHIYATCQDVRIICRPTGAGKGRRSCRSPGGTYIGAHINDFYLE